MKQISIIFSVLLGVLILSGCSFQDIGTDKTLITTTEDSDNSGIVPAITTTNSEITSPEDSTIDDSDDSNDSKFPFKTKVTANVNARMGASTADDIFKIIPGGTEITVVGESGDWYKITINKKEVYVIKEYVEDIIDNSSVE